VLEVSIRQDSSRGAAWMSTQNRGAIDDYSKENRESRALPPLSIAARAAAGLGLAGAVLAVVATFTKVIEIKVLTVPTYAHEGWDRYGPALLLLALFALLMLAGAWRGARPAMAGLSAAGLAILAIAIVVDVPHLDDKGVWPSADLYEDAVAGAGIGFYFETAAGMLMLLSGALMLLLAPRRSDARANVRAPRSEPREMDVRPAEEGVAADDDWFAPRAQRLTQPQPPPRRRRFRR
jgi:hypothetical protein